MRQYKNIKDGEIQRKNEEEIQRVEERRRIREEADMIERQRRREAVAAWRANKIEIQNLQRLQLEEDLMELLKEKQFQ